MTKFPELPIITPDPPRKSQLEKYGSLLFAGVGGLIVLVALVAWFGYGVWSMRAVWADVYVLNDPRTTEAKRVEAAERLARDPRVTDRQKWDLALSKTPPDVARYLLAESLTGAAAEADPHAYGLAVARSEGWPDWLRALLARPLAYSAAEGGSPEPASLREMTRLADPFVALWARFALAVAGTGEDAGEARRVLAEAARTDGPTRDFAEALREAADSPQPRRSEALDRATGVLRSDHPGASRLWGAWENGRRASAPELHAAPR